MILNDRQVEKNTVLKRKLSYFLRRGLVFIENKSLGIDLDSIKSQTNKTVEI